VNSIQIDEEFHFLGNFNSMTHFEDARGVIRSIDVSDALKRVLVLAKKGMGMTDTGNLRGTGLIAVLHVQYFLKYFREKLDVVLNDVSIQYGVVNF
jgi:hypothetical protein